MDILIVGAPRTGTTLFAAMIGSHPEISILNEEKSNAWRKALGRKHQGLKLCIPNQIELDRKSEKAEHGELKRQILKTVAEFALWDAGPRKAWGEERIDATIAQFLKLDDPRVMAILRGPEQAVASMQKRGGQPLTEAFFRWLRAVEIMETLREEAPKRFAVVGFERLVSDPEEVLRACAKWLGVDYAPAMLNAYTPLYKMDKIDAEKAGEEDAEFRKRLADAFPQHWKAYKKLKKRALGGT